MFPSMTEFFRVMERPPRFGPIMMGSL